MVSAAWPRFCDSYKFAAVRNLKAINSSPDFESLPMSSQSYVKPMYPPYYDVTDKNRYSPAQKRIRYQVSPSCANTSLAATHCHTGPPILMGYTSEGSLKVEDTVHCWAGKYLINVERLVTNPMQCRPGDANRHVPR